MAKCMSKNGFTLIELIITISILGIISIVALPRFIDTSNDALVAKLEAMKDNLESATYRVHSKALLEGKLSGGTSIIIEGDRVSINSGYPIGNWDGAVRHILNLSHVGNSSKNCPHDWCGRGNTRSLPGGYTTTSGTGVKVTPQTYDHDDLCGIIYINHYDGNKPEIAVLSSGC